MITHIITALLIWTFIAALVTVYTILTAKEGMEDEDGFHTLERPPANEPAAPVDANPMAPSPPPRADITDVPEAVGDRLPSAGKPATIVSLIRRVSIQRATRREMRPGRRRVRERA